jgi:hypothetical protein
MDCMTAAIDRQLEQPGKWVQDTNPGSGTGRFMHDRHLWPTQADFRDYALESGVGELAAQAMKATATLRRRAAAWPYRRAGSAMTHAGIRVRERIRL